MSSVASSPKPMIEEAVDLTSVRGSRPHALANPRLFGCWYNRHRLPRRLAIFATTQTQVVWGRKNQS